MYPATYIAPIKTGVNMSKQKSVCKACSNEFVVGKGCTGQFCSRICYDNSRPKPIQKLCLFCRKKFFYYLIRNQETCSLSCRSKFKYQKRINEFNALSDEQKLNLLKERYEKFVVRKDGCWDWNAAKVLGYGAFRLGRKSYKAHRVSWMIHKGIIPSALFVLHKCYKNRQCTNPDHLYLGTALENNHDIINAGDKKALNKEQILEIKKLLSLDVPQTKIAKKFNITSSTVRYHKKKFERSL